MIAPSIQTAHGCLDLPAFLPDATRGAVRCVEPAALAEAGVQGLMVNTFHLSRRPGGRLLHRLGGIHQFMGWKGPIVSDSGGFQVLSMVRSNPRHGTIRPNGVIFRDNDSGKKTVFTPDKCIQLQFALGSDIIIALDDCTGPLPDLDELRQSTERTIRWFRQSRREYERQLEQRRDLKHRPLLVGVIQGGTDLELRRACTEAILEVGADAVGFGGWPVDEKGRVELDLIRFVVDLLPRSMPMFALGVGKPENVAAVAALGPRFVFDCTLPTRDARRGRLYRFLDEGASPGSDPFYRHLYVLDAEHTHDDRPVSEECDCACCRKTSRAYLHHLFKIGDAAAQRLATIHNVRFYQRLIERMRVSKPADGCQGTSE